MLSRIFFTKGTNFISVMIMKHKFPWLKYNRDVASHGHAQNGCECFLEKNLRVSFTVQWVNTKCCRSILK